MDEIKSLVQKLNEASAAYYSGSEIMSNKEWDEAFDHLKALEKETGKVLPDSPTRNVGSMDGKGLKKVKHEYPAPS